MLRLCSSLFLNTIRLSDQPPMRRLKGDQLQDPYETIPEILHLQQNKFHVGPSSKTNFKI